MGSELIEIHVVDWRLYLCVRFGFVDCESKTSVLSVTVMLLCGNNGVMCWHHNNTYLLNTEIYGDNFTLENKEYFLTYNVSALHSYVCTAYYSDVASSVSTAARALTTLYRCSVLRNRSEHIFL